MTEEEIMPKVKSPSRMVHTKEGKGFSLPEIKEAGKSVQLLKQLGIPIDFFRRSSHAWNVDQLKDLKAPKTKKKKKREWVPAEHKPKPKPKPQREPLAFKKEEKVEEKKKPKKKAPKKKEKKEAVPESEKIPLTELMGLGPATADKFKELGVDSVQELMKEDPAELGTLIKGCSEERIRGWIDEGKELIEKK